MQIQMDLLSVSLHPTYVESETTTHRHHIGKTETEPTLWASPAQQYQLVILTGRFDLNNFKSQDKKM